MRIAPVVAVLSALSVLSVASGSLSPTAKAAFPGANGSIVFQTNRDGNSEIYTMNADGTNRVNLTRNAADDVEPHWSSDGRKIVFALLPRRRICAA